MQRQIQRAVAQIAISGGSETGLSGAAQGAFRDCVERDNATAADRRSPTIHAAVARATSVDSKAFDYLTSPAVENPHLAMLFKNL